MSIVQIRWNSLLNLTELEFVPEQPKVLKMSDELIQSISWLTGATGHDRRMLRCTDQGALLVAPGWSNLVSIEIGELYPESASPKTFTATVTNQGVLIATSTQVIKATITRVSGGASEFVYIPPNWLYWYPHRVYTVVAGVVPDPNGTASYVGITAFN